MDTPIKKSPHPLMWVAGIAIILFCAAGIAAIMGWIPNSMSQQGDIPLPPNADKTLATDVKPADEPVTERPHRKHVQSQEALPAQVRCDSCGVVESTREIDTKGQGSGLGVVGGAVVGGILGHQVGGGRGKDLATIAGAVGGGYAGNEVEKRSKSTRSFEVTVRMDDGSSRVVPFADQPAWQPGDHVEIVDGALRSH